MRLEEIILCNFRCYTQEVRIPVDDITAFIGKNDVGKTSILEALDTFFNQSKLDLRDKNIFHLEEDTIIGCVFSDFPSQIVIDEAVSTSLSQEYLLNEKGWLEIRKIYGAAGKETVWIYANHPSNDGFSDLLSKKNSELKTRIRALHLEDHVNLTINSEMRHKLWDQLGTSIIFAPTLINADQADEKKLWPKIQLFLPVYRLFKSDRTSTDKDEEAQSPISAAMKLALQEKQEELSRIAEDVRQKVTFVANKTIEKLSEFNPDLASTLIPKFEKDPMWEKAFSFSLTSDNEIPINKRGSGVRRLILLSFFRATIESELFEGKRIIYAIEEPETSQHPDAQKEIITTFTNMVEKCGCQILLTTHVPGLAGILPIESLRLVYSENSITCVDSSRNAIMIEKIADTLGVFPTLTHASEDHHDVRLIVCVEGPTDISFLERISFLAHQSDPTILDLSTAEDILILPLGGSSLQNWVNHHYLQKLHIREYHIYDGDNCDSHAEACATVIARGDGSLAVQTQKRELENYIHSDPIREVFGINLEITDEMDVSTEISRILHESDPQAYSPKVVKRKISENCVPKMTLEMLQSRDPEGEVLGWLRDISFAAIE